MPKTQLWDAEIPETCYHGRVNNLPIPKAILFDLDDTILDFGGSTDVCWEIVCERFAPEACLPAQELNDAINEYREWYWSDPDRHREGRVRLEDARKDIVREAMLRLGVDNRDLADRIGEEYTIARDKALCILPGAIEALGRLRGMGIRLALVTNGPADMQRGKIERFGLRDYFEFILIEGEFGMGKPDERVYLYVLDQLGVSPAEAWMVGDNPEWEVAVPQRLGMKGIWYDRRGTGLPATSRVRPDHIIRQLDELVSLFLR